MNKKKGKARKRLISLKSLHKKTWSVFSRYIRSRDADFRGYTECYTCRRKYLWQELDAGHWHHGKLDFDEMNIHPQCSRDNRYFHGSLSAYTLRLIEDYGHDAVKDLRNKAFRHPGYKREELLNLLFKYTELNERIPKN